LKFEPGGARPAPTNLGERVVVAVRWAGLSLKPPPSKTEGGAPKGILGTENCGGLREGGSEAADDAVLAEGHHGVE